MNSEEEQAARVSSEEGVAPLVNSESWDDEWLEAEIARELAAYEDRDTRPSASGATSSSMERDPPGTSPIPRDHRAAQSTSDWMQARFEARARAREINDLPIEVPGYDLDRPTKDDSRGQCRHDDAIDELVQQMQARDAKNIAMEAQIQDDLASVAQLVAGVEGGLATVSSRRDLDGKEASRTILQEQDTPSTSELVDQLHQLSKRSPTGRLANALQQPRDVDYNHESDVNANAQYGLDWTEDLSHRSREVLSRVHQYQLRQQNLHSSPARTAKSDSDYGDADGSSDDELGSDDFADFEISAASGYDSFSSSSTSSPSSPNAAADELVQRSDPLLANRSAYVSTWEAAQARQGQLREEFRDAERKLMDFSRTLKDDFQINGEACAKTVEPAERGGSELWELASSAPDGALNYCGDGVHRFAPPAFQQLSGAASEIPRSSYEAARSQCANLATPLIRRTQAEQVR